jgi:hypothetical protein
VNVLIGPFLPIPYLSEVITTVLLVLFEITKRKFSDLFWDHWHRHLRVQWVYGVINFGLLFGISLVGSGFGVYFGVTDTSQEAKQIGINDDHEAIALSEEITEIDTKIAQHQANTNPQGVITGPANRRSRPWRSSDSKTKRSSKPSMASTRSRTPRFLPNGSCVRISGHTSSLPW